MSESPDKTLKGAARQQLLEELHSKYTEKKLSRRLVFLRKKYAWLFVVRSSYFLKRLIDVVVSLMALILLFPIMLVVAIAVKLQDGGPVFYVTHRIGRWGAPFPFPKFRSMVMDAGEKKEELFSQNDSTLQPFKPGAIVGPLRLTNCRRVILHEHAIVQRNTRSVIANVSQLTAFLQSASV